MICVCVRRCRQMNSFLVWAITGGAILLIRAGPRRISPAVWACAGALLVVLCRLISSRDALAAVGRGTDVYLFLTGMMILAELARREGFFDWVAMHAVDAAKGSPQRLFAIVYAVGTLVTIFLSNDATAVVLTPAVYAATQRARAPPLPYLSFAPSSRMRRASCCRFRTRRIWSSMERTCRLSGPGSNNSASPPSLRSLSRTLCCDGPSIGRLQGTLFARSICRL